MRKTLARLGAIALVAAAAPSAAQAQFDFTTWAAAGNVSSTTSNSTQISTSNVFSGCLLAGATNCSYIVSPVFNVSNLTTLSFNALFSTSDYLPFNDYGVVRLFDLTNSVFTDLFYRDVSIVGNFGSSGTVAISTILSAGSYQLRAEAANRGDSGVDTHLTVSNMGATNVVPEPATITLLATGLAGMVGAARRRRKANLA